MKDFRLSGPFGLSQIRNSNIVATIEYINKCGCVPVKPYFWTLNFEFHEIFTCEEFLIFLIKKKKTIIGSGSYLAHELRFADSWL